MCARINEETVLDAVDGYYNNPECRNSIRFTANTYNIPKTTHRHRLHGRPPVDGAQVNNRLLSPQQSQTIQDLAMTMDKYGFALNYSFLREAVQERTGQKLGKNWCSRWIAANRELHSVFYTARDKDRQSATNYTSFKSFLDLVWHPFCLRQNISITNFPSSPRFKTCMRFMMMIFGTWMRKECSLVWLLQVKLSI